jgi:hypothetical protein
VELETLAAQVDDVQFPAERHHALAHPDQPKSVTFLATLDRSASIILDRQRQPSSLRRGLFRQLRTDVQGD